MIVSGVPEPTGLRWRAWQRLMLGGGWALLGSGMLSSGLLSGCGPSFEVLAEGDLRFVHCDRLDLDPEVAPSYRLECWRDWRRSYTYGQTLDRVEYAQRRIAEVVSGDSTPPFRLPSGAPTARHRFQPVLHPAPAPVLGRLEAPLVAGSTDPSTPARAATATTGSASGSDSGHPARAATAAAAAPDPAPKTPAEAAAAARAVPADPVCRSRCEAESSACLPGCESKPRGCQPCAPELASCLRDCGSER